MGSRTTAAYNPTLTNYAYGLMPSLQSAIADFVSPRVQVPATIGYFKKFSDKNSFVVYNTNRALGGAATRIGFAATDGTFNCRPNALEIAIDDAERDAGAAGAGISIDESRISTLMNATMLSHENAAITKAYASVSAQAGKGIWSDTNVDPIVEIDYQLEAMAEAFGMLPNRIVMGISAWNTLRNHPLVTKRFPGAPVIAPTLQNVSSMLLNPAIEIRLATISKDATKLGGTQSNSNIFGANVLMFYASPNPSVYDPSFMKSFFGGSYGITQVRTYRDESARSDIHAVDWSVDIQVVASSLCRRITVT